MQAMPMRRDEAPSTPVELVDSHYFLRNSRYTMVQGRVVLVDSRGPRMVAMEAWPQFVFLSADGLLSVGEFMTALDGMHPQGMPDKTRNILKDLVRRGRIVLDPVRRTLPYGLSLPIEQQEGAAFDPATLCNGPFSQTA
jgi:hypothetical protein